jgi:hypothetical protein
MHPSGKTVVLGSSYADAAAAGRAGDRFVAAYRRALAGPVIASP